MPNANYLRGVRLERELVNKARAKGHIATRSAGSHSPYDVWVWDRDNLTITLTQLKRHKKRKGNKGQPNPVVQEHRITNVTVIERFEHHYDKRITEAKRKK